MVKKSNNISLSLSLSSPSANSFVYCIYNIIIWAAAQKKMSYASSEDFDVHPQSLIGASTFRSVGS